MVKFCVIDTETTGTNDQKHGVVQISALVGFAEGRKVQWREAFNAHVRPFPSDVIEAEALEITKLTREQIAGFPDPQTVHRQFVEFLSRHCSKFDRHDKMYFAGYNVKFDDGFVRQFFLKNGDKYFGSFFWVPAFDVMNLCVIPFLSNRDILPNFRFETVAAALGFTAAGELHDAKTDSLLTAKLLERFIERGMLECFS